MKFKELNYDVQDDFCEFLSDLAGSEALDFFNNLDCLDYIIFPNTVDGIRSALSEYNPEEILSLSDETTPQDEFIYVNGDLFSISASELFNRLDVIELDDIKDALISVDLDFSFQTQDEKEKEYLEKVYDNLTSLVKNIDLLDFKNEDNINIVKEVLEKLNSLIPLLDKFKQC